MTDIRADDASPAGEDRLPWLEAVEEEDGQAGPSTLKMIMAVVIGLAGIGAIISGIFWLTNRNMPDGGTGEAEVIAAAEGDYKVRPDDPGGMAVEGEGDTAFAASAGADPKGTLDTNKAPEAPVAKGGAGDAALIPAPTPTPAAEPKQAPAASGSAPAAGGGGGATIQLGAFSSQTGATGAWKALSGRFAYLAPLSHSVVPVSSGGKTLYRLRASGPNAENVCGRLRVAGESCVKI
jgi:hypothetical protein